MRQSRTMSAVEAFTNITVGYAVSVATNLVLLPWLGFPVQFGQAVGIAAVFTLVSLVRSYTLRRVFERWRQ